MTTSDKNHDDLVQATQHPVGPECVHPVADLEALVDFDARSVDQLVVSNLGLSLKQAEAEIERLRKALAPFAAIPPVKYLDGPAPFYWCVVGNPNKVHFTHADVERAKAALSPSHGDRTEADIPTDPHHGGKIWDRTEVGGGDNATKCATEGCETMVPREMGVCLDHYKPEQAVCPVCQGHGIEEVYGGHGTVLEIKCSMCQPNDPTAFIDEVLDDIFGKPESVSLPKAVTPEISQEAHQPREAQGAIIPHPRASSPSGGTQAASETATESKGLAE